MTKTNQQSFELYKGRSFFLPSIITSILLIWGFAAIFLFVPEVIVKNSQSGVIFYGKSFFDEFNLQFITNGSPGQIAGAIIFWCLFTASLISGVFFGWFGIRYLYAFITYPQWFRTYMDEHTKIINSCDPSTFKDRVAMLIATCNDLAPNTILQSAKQTYKNIDVWILDDSNKKESIIAIDNFARDHGFHVLRRSDEHKKMHPTKVGNVFYFLKKYGDKYDVIFENDSSSIITSTFVQNGLCYYHTPLWSHEKDGGIVANGSFFGTKNLISWFYSKTFSFGDIHGAGGSELTGSPSFLHGWGCLYKVSALKSIDLKTVECPTCDASRGLFLSLNGYVNYFNPFDFCGKLCPQNMEAIKKQRLKWSSGDVHVFRTGLTFSKYPSFRQDILAAYASLCMVIAIPINFILVVGNFIVLTCLNFFFVNTTSLIVLICYFLLFLIIFIIFVVKNKAPIKILLFALASLLIFLAISYKRLFQIVWRGLIKHSWSSGAVTAKTAQKTTIKQKLRMSLFDFCIILVGIVLCIILTFAVSRENLSIYCIWVNIFLLVCLPSIIYILLIWIGEIPVRVGYDNQMLNYDHWLYDFRYKYVSQSSIWKKQHKKNEA